MHSSAMGSQPVRKKISFKKFLQRVTRFLDVTEETLAETNFYIFRTDTNTVVARGIDGYEAAKDRANQLRKQLGLKWDQVKFRAERKAQSSETDKPASKPRKIKFGVSHDGKTFTNAYGQKSKVQYSPNFNRSKGRRFRGYTDAQGNYHDID